MPKITQNKSAIYFLDRKKMLINVIQKKIKTQVDIENIENSRNKYDIIFQKKFTLIDEGNTSLIKIWYEKGNYHFTVSLDKKDTRVPTLKCFIPERKKDNSIVDAKKMVEMIVINLYPSILLDMWKMYNNRSLTPLFNATCKKMNSNFLDSHIKPIKTN